jgi:hypothetical protein
VSELYILLGSAVAVGLMVAVAAWARIARPTAPLDEPAARALLAAEFPDQAPTFVWIAADGAGAIARAGATALVLYRLGDSWVARTLRWDDALTARVARGTVRLKLRDPAAPVARLAVSGINPWPPETLQEVWAA